MTIDRSGLADFLRRTRTALQPEDVGLPRGQRRRTAGLRREEVAALAHMSADYYARLEQERGPQPSEQMVAAIAQGLHLSLAGRDHLFRLAGHRPPERDGVDRHVGPGLLRIFERLQDTPAEVVTECGETVLQTPPDTALVGDLTRFRGPQRSIYARWFLDPSARERYAPGEHDYLGRLWASQLREIATRRGAGSRAAGYVDLLLAQSDEFRALWARHEVGLQPQEVKHFLHPELGPLELTCQTLLDPSGSHALLVYTAEPGSETHRNLPLLAAFGADALTR